MLISWHATYVIDKRVLKFSRCTKKSAQHVSSSVTITINWDVLCWKYITIFTLNVAGSTRRFLSTHCLPNVNKNRGKQISKTATGEWIFRFRSVQQFVLVQLNYDDRQLWSLLWFLLLLLMLSSLRGMRVFSFSYLKFPHFPHTTHRRHIHIILRYKIVCSMDFPFSRR